MPRKRGRGRPKFKPTKASRQRVKTLIGMGTSVRDTARLLGVTAPTLRKHFALEISTAAAEATAAVVLALFRAATDATRPNVRAARAWFDLAGRHPHVAAAVVRASTEGKKQAAKRVAATIASNGRFKPGEPPRLVTLNGEPVKPDGTDDAPE